MAEATSLGEVLSKIQAEIKAPKNLYNKFGGYSYRNAESILEALKPFEKKYGVFVTLTDEVIEMGSRFYVKATATIANGAEFITTTAYAREVDTKKGMDEAQITGSASSYARKYALNGLFLLDDTKDADTEEYQTESKPKATKKTGSPEPKPNAALICERCGKPIESAGKFPPSAVAEQTRAKFGKQMCFECGKITKKEREQPIESVLADLPFPIEE